MRKIKLLIIFSIIHVVIHFLSASSYSAMTGEDAYLVTPMKYPHVAVDEATVDEYWKAIVTNDIPYGITELYQKNKLFQVENNVKVKIIDKTLTKVKIRILEGDKRGSSGWVASEWIQDSISTVKTCAEYLNTYPKTLPKGYIVEQKTKYRIIVNLFDTTFAIYDTDKIQELKDCTIRVYPPTLTQEYYKEDNWSGIVKKWSRRTLREQFETPQIPAENVSIIRKSK